MELPGGGIALDYDVTLTANLPLVPADGSEGKRACVLGISGSLRGESHNSRLLRARSLPPGVELDVYKDLARIPAFDEDRESDPPGAVLRLREEIAAADALLFSTPEYNASIPGVLKNALDWASRPFPDNALVIGRRP